MGLRPRTHAWHQLTGDQDGYIDFLGNEKVTANHVIMNQYPHKYHMTKKSKNSLIDLGVVFHQSSHTSALCQADL